MPYDRLPNRFSPSEDVTSDLLRLCTLPLRESSRPQTPWMAASGLVGAPPLVAILN